MKWFGWVVKTMLSTVVVTAVSLAVTWSMVNIYIQQFISPLNAQQALRPVALTDLIAFMVAQGTGGGGRSSVEEPGDAAGTGGETGVLEPAHPAQGEEAPGNVPNETEQAPAPKDALPVMGTVQSAEAGFISADELDEKKDRITPEDREEIFSIMMSRVPPEQLQNISQLLEGGITAEEVNQAAAILKEHLNEQEYEKLIGILMKY
jgi:hypothetical protein